MLAAHSPSRCATAERVRRRRTTLLALVGLPGASPSSRRRTAGACIRVNIGKSWAEAWEDAYEEHGGSKVFLVIRKPGPIWQRKKKGARPVPLLPRQSTSPHREVVRLEGGTGTFGMRDVGGAQAGAPIVSARSEGVSRLHEGTVVEERVRLGRHRVRRSCRRVGLVSHGPVARVRSATL